MANRWFLKGGPRSVCFDCRYYDWDLEQTFDPPHWPEWADKCTKGHADVVGTLTTPEQCTDFEPPLEAL